MGLTRVVAVVAGCYWLAGMHFFMHNPGGAGLYLPFNIWGWIFASLMIACSLWQITLRQRVVLSPLLGSLGVAALLLLLPMAYPAFSLKDYAIPRLLGVAAGLLFLFGLYQWQWYRQQRDRLLYMMLAAVAIEALLGLVQYYLLTPGNWLGYNVEANRPYGIFQQPNVMATFMATGLALASWLELRGAGSRWLASLRYGVIMAAALLLVVLQSRVGQLGAVLALLLLLPALHKQQRLWRIVMLVLLGISLGLCSQYVIAGVKRGAEIYQSGGIRTVYWAYAYKLFMQSPWLGWGYGGFESVFLHHYMADKALAPTMVSIEYNLDHPHNELLYWAVEGGIAPVVGIIMAGVSLLWRLTKAGWMNGMALLALLIPVMLHSQTEYPFYHAIALWWLFLSLVYLTDSEVEEQLIAGHVAPSWRELSWHGWLLPRFVALLVPLLVIPFMLTALHTAWVVTKYERGGYKEPALLLAVVNPLAWLTRYEYNTNAVQLMVGLQTKNQAALQAYLTWGQDFVRYMPRVNVYANMVIALQALGRMDEADAMRRDALLLYPQDPLLSTSGGTAVISGADPQQQVVNAN